MWSCCGASAADRLLWWFVESGSSAKLGGLCRANPGDTPEPRFTEAGNHPKLRRSSTSRPSCGQRRVGEHPHRGLSDRWPAAANLPPQDGFLLLDREKFHASFAGDLSEEEAVFMADSQVPWGVDALGGTIGEPA